MNKYNIVLGDAVKIEEVDFLIKEAQGTNGMYGTILKDNTFIVEKLRWVVLPKEDLQGIFDELKKLGVVE